VDGGRKGSHEDHRGEGEWMTYGSRGKVEGRINWREEDPHGLNTGQLRGAGLHEHR
jgi:hypothetical protein